MKSALIGYTGFVGSNLMTQAHFDDLYNSRNIGEAAGREYGLVVCAAPSAEKWKANLDPGGDMERVEKLMSGLDPIRPGTFVLISTVDVYPDTVGVDEGDAPGDSGLHAYGKHRRMLEQFARDRFGRCLIVRLPALFGKGLKKNFVYDLIHDNRLDLTDADSRFQFYYLGHLWDDIRVSLEHSLELLNIASEPASAREVALRCAGLDFGNKTGKPPAAYDVRSRHDRIFGGRDGYLYSKASVMEELKRFIGAERRGHAGHL